MFHINAKGFDYEHDQTRNKGIVDRGVFCLSGLMLRGFIMSNTRLKQKYAEALRQLHICSPASKRGLKALMNYYYGLMVDRGII